MSGASSAYEARTDRVIGASDSADAIPVMAEATAVGSFHTGTYAAVPTADGVGESAGRAGGRRKREGDIEGGPAGGGEVEQAGAAGAFSANPVASQPVASPTHNTVSVDNAVAVPADYATGTFVQPWDINHSLYFGTAVAPVGPAHDTAGDVINRAQRQQILLNLYKVSRIIRYFTLLDGIFLVIFGLFLPLFFILLPFPICGYWGARSWRYILLYIYLVYLIAEIVLGILSLIFIQSTPFVVFRLLYIAVNLFIARYAVRLCSYILVMSPEDIEFLKHSDVIKSIESRLLC